LCLGGHYFQCLGQLRSGTEDDEEGRRGGREGGRGRGGGRGVSEKIEGHGHVEAGLDEEGGLPSLLPSLGVLPPVSGEEFYAAVAAAAATVQTAAAVLPLDRFPCVRVDSRACYRLEGMHTQASSDGSGGEELGERCGLAGVGAAVVKDAVRGREGGREGGRA